LQQVKTSEKDIQTSHVEKGEAVMFLRQNTRQDCGQRAQQSKRVCICYVNNNGSDVISVSTRTGLGAS
jgi:hypothetical protein